MTNTTDTDSPVSEIDEAMKSFYEKEFGDLPESAWRPIWDVYIREVTEVFDFVREQHAQIVRVYSDEIVAAADKGVNAERYRRKARAKWEQAGLRIEYVKRSRLSTAQNRMDIALANARQEAQR